MLPEDVRIIFYREKDDSKKMCAKFTSEKTHTANEAVFFEHIGEGYDMENACQNLFEKIHQFQDDSQKQAYQLYQRLPEFQRVAAQFQKLSNGTWITVDNLAKKTNQKKQALQEVLTTLVAFRLAVESQFPNGTKKYRITIEPSIVNANIEKDIDALRRKINQLENFKIQEEGGKHDK